MYSDQVLDVCFIQNLLQITFSNNFDNLGPIRINLCFCLVPRPQDVGGAKVGGLSWKGHKHKLD
jgi:hypothetical protein